MNHPQSNNLFPNLKVSRSLSECYFEIGANHLNERSYLDAYRAFETALKNLNTKFDDVQLRYEINYLSAVCLENNFKIGQDKSPLGYYFECLTNVLNSDIKFNYFDEVFSRIDRFLISYFETKKKSTPEIIQFNKVISESHKIGFSKSSSKFNEKYFIKINYIVALSFLIDEKIDEALNFFRLVIQYNNDCLLNDDDKIIQIKSYFFTFQALSSGKQDVIDPSFLIDYSAAYKDCLQINSSASKNNLYFIKLFLTDLIHRGLYIHATNFLSKIYGIGLIDENLFSPDCDYDISLHLSDKLIEVYKQKINSILNLETINELKSVSKYLLSRIYFFTDDLKIFQYISSEVQKNKIHDSDWSLHEVMFLIEMQIDIEKGINMLNDLIENNISIFFNNAYLKILIKFLTLKEIKGRSNLFKGYLLLSLAKYQGRFPDFKEEMDKWDPNLCQYYDFISDNSEISESNVLNPEIGPNKYGEIGSFLLIGKKYFELKDYEDSAINLFQVGMRYNWAGNFKKSIYYFDFIFENIISNGEFDFSHAESKYSEFSFFFWYYANSLSADSSKSSYPFHDIYKLQKSLNIWKKGQAFGKVSSDNTWIFGTAAVIYENLSIISKKRLSDLCYNALLLYQKAFLLNTSWAPYSISTIFDRLEIKKSIIYPLIEPLSKYDYSVKSFLNKSTSADIDFIDRLLVSLLNNGYAKITSVILENFKLIAFEGNDEIYQKAYWQYSGYIDFLNRNYNKASEKIERYLEGNPISNWGIKELWALHMVMQCAYYDIKIEKSIEYADQIINSFPNPEDSLGTDINIFARAYFIKGIYCFVSGAEVGDNFNLSIKLYNIGNDRLNSIENNLNLILLHLFVNNFEEANRLLLDFLMQNLSPNQIDLFFLEFNTLIKCRFTEKYFLKKYVLEILYNNYIERFSKQKKYVYEEWPTDTFDLEKFSEDLLIKIDANAVEKELLRILHLDGANICSTAINMSIALLKAQHFKFLEAWDFFSKCSFSDYEIKLFQDYTDLKIAALIDGNDNYLSLFKINNSILYLNTICNSDLQILKLRCRLIHFHLSENNSSDAISTLYSIIKQPSPKWSNEFLVETIVLFLDSNFLFWKLKDYIFQKPEFLQECILIIIDILTKGLSRLCGLLIPSFTENQSKPITQLPIEFGSTIVHRIDPNNEKSESGKFLYKDIPAMRNRLLADFSFTAPPVRARGSGLLPYDYQILFDEVPIVRKTIFNDGVFCLLSEGFLRNHGITETFAFPGFFIGEQGTIVSGQDIEILEREKLEYLEDIEYITHDIEVVLRRNLSYFMGIDEVRRLIEESGHQKEFEDFLTDSRSNVLFARLLRTLVKENTLFPGKSLISDLLGIIAIIKNSGGLSVENMPELIRQIRLLNKATLSGNRSEVKQVFVPVEIEEVIGSFFREVQGKLVFTPFPDKAMDVINSIKSIISSPNRNTVLIVRNYKYRPYLRRLLEYRFSDLMVMSEEELEKVPGGLVEMTPSYL